MHIPGRAVRFLTKKTDKILLGFNKTKDFFEDEYDNKLIYVGNPVNTVKKNFTEKQKSDILKNIGLKSDLPTVLVFGGSQGSKRINDSVIHMIKNNKVKDFQIILATGRKQYDYVKEELEKENINIKKVENTAIMPYIYNMEELMSIADLIVSRSGAMTVTEVANFGKPAIFIPFPSVGANRQIDNAKVLEDIGAAKIILNDDLVDDALYDKLSQLIFYKDKLKKMGEKAYTLKTEGVLEKIYRRNQGSFKLNNIIIVESPAKAGTIKKFLPRGTKVIASMGHVRDLPKSRLAVDIKKDFEPDYINIRRERRIN